MTKLIVKDGKLYVPNAAIHDADARKWYGEDDVIVMVKYGLDCDTIPWPIPNPADKDIKLPVYMDLTPGSEERLEWHRQFSRRQAAEYWTLDKWRDAFAHAMFDDREQGILPPYQREVVLPDGMAFEIDTARFYCPECDRDEGQGHDLENGCTVGEENANV